MALLVSVKCYWALTPLNEGFILLLLPGIMLPVFLQSSLSGLLTGQLMGTFQYKGFAAAVLYLYM